ncbi:MAG: MoaF N-terminal domain-containing protein [Burkholderiales bacterium]|nr:MoaF N-terminal domain-containing protein [Burkholderiales bacterium]OJX07865.1 MAG: molybdenum cofactor biosynthesis protein F [Burkholderiales bacterium 70-64]
MDAARPADWKNYEDFAAGIATNRLPCTDAWVGRTLTLRLGDERLELRPQAAHSTAWKDDRGAGVDWYEAIELGPDLHFVDLTFASRLTIALTVVFNTRTRRALGIRTRVRDPGEAPGEPRPAQEFLPGIVGDDPSAATGSVPAPTRDLIGLRTHQVYSPQHTYEHTYLNSQRYAWQCLVGVQRGQGDVDLASYYKFDEDQYVFTFREFLIPVASVFFFDFGRMRSTGKFLGITGSGEVANNPAGAFMRKVSMTFYPPDAQPV